MVSVLIYQEIVQYIGIPTNEQQTEQNEAAIETCITPIQWKFIPNFNFIDFTIVLKHFNHNFFSLQKPAHYLCS